MNLSEETIKYFCILYVISFIYVVSSAFLYQLYQYCIIIITAVFSIVVFTIINRIPAINLADESSLRLSDRARTCNVLRKQARSRLQGLERQADVVN